MASDPKEGDLQHALEEAAEAAGHDPDEAEIAADDAGGTRLAEQLNDPPGGATITGRVVARPAKDPALGSISGRVSGKPRNPNLGSISGNVAGRKKPPPGTTSH